MRRMTRCWLAILCLGWPTGLAAAASTSESNLKEWGEAWIEGRTCGWEQLILEAKRFRQARQLLQSLHAQTEYDARGRLLAKVHRGGSRETWRYDPRGLSATVWEAGNDGQFLEERYYWRQLLQARLQRDGTLQIYHHLAPLHLSDDSEAKPDSTEPALYVSVTDRLQNRILLFNEHGRLLGGFYPDGSPWSNQNPGSGEDLDDLVPREMLMLPENEL